MRVALYLLTVLSTILLNLPREKEVKPVEVVRVPDFCEGIVFDHDGDAYISHGKFISRIRPDGKASVWAEGGAPNGHKVLADGTHLVCDPSQHAVLRLDATGKLLGKASAECDGRPLREPNDLTLDAKGGFYFTDPGPYDPEKAAADGTVHYVDPQGKTHVVTQGLAYPNGIVIRPDGKTLLVGESLKNRILSYEIGSDGKVGPMMIFANLPVKQGEQIDNQPDGMCLDAEGNLYVAHFGMGQVQVLDRQGKLVRRYSAGNLSVSNVAFGGPGMDQLYLTGSIGIWDKTEGALFRLDLKGVRGLTILPKKSGLIAATKPGIVGHPHSAEVSGKIHLE